MKDNEKYAVAEVYLVKVGCGGLKTEEARQRLHELGVQLNGRGRYSYVADRRWRKTSGFVSGRKFVIVPTKEPAGELTTELVHPHHAVMGRSFLAEVLESRPYVHEQEDLERLGEMAAASVELARDGWNPQLFASGISTRMVVHDDLVRNPALPSSPDGPRADWLVYEPSAVSGEFEAWRKRQTHYHVATLTEWRRWATEEQRKPGMGYEEYEKNKQAKNGRRKD